MFLCLPRGAVDLDGRIEPGDMLLQVCHLSDLNADHSF